MKNWNCCACASAWIRAMRSYDANCCSNRLCSNHSCDANCCCYRLSSASKCSHCISFSALSRSCSFLYSISDCSAISFCTSSPSLSLSWRFPKPKVLPPRPPLLPLGPALTGPGGASGASDLVRLLARWRLCVEHGIFAPKYLNI